MVQRRVYLAVGAIAACMGRLSPSKRRPLPVPPLRSRGKFNVNHLKGADSATERAREREMALEDASKPRDIDRERGEQRMRGIYAKDVQWAKGWMDRSRDERESALKCLW